MNTRVLRERWNQQNPKPDYFTQLPTAQKREILDEKNKQYRKEVYGLEWPTPKNHYFYRKINRWTLEIEEASYKKIPRKKISKKRSQANNHIQRIKETLDLLEVAQHYGIELHKQGRYTMICCPHPDHQDNNPSCIINGRETRRYANTFKCFSCGARGDIIDFAALMEART